MTIQDKELLLKDLSARLPYGVKVQVTDEYSYKEPLEILAIDAHKGIVKLGDNVNNFYFTHVEKVEDIKPYLCPMSSMTEEEKVEYCDLQAKFLLSSQYPVTDAYELFDWLNAHHFDYRGLIPMGLALHATDGIYNF